jgi:hypothetical protein
MVAIVSLCKVMVGPVADMVPCLGCHFLVSYKEADWSSGKVLSSVDFLMPYASICCFAVWSHMQFNCAFLLRLLKDA